MSGAQTSTFSNAQSNVLFNPLAVPEAQKLQNTLAGQQIDLSNANVEQVSRLSAGLLNEPDPAKRAELYSRGVGYLQSQGFAMHAPPTLPDESTLRFLALQGTPSEKQAEWLANIQANKAYSSATSPTASTATPGATAAPAAGGGVATTPSATIEPTAFNNATAVRDGLIKRGLDPDTATGLAASALHESVANPRTGRGDNGNAAGLFMWTGPRLQAYIDKNGHPPDGSPLDEQLDFVMHELNGSEAAAAAKIAAAQGPAAKAAAVSQYYLRPKDTVGEMQRRSATALQLQQQIGGGGTPGRVQVASVTPTTATDGTTAPPGSTAPSDAAWDLPGAPAPDQPPPPATTTAAPPAATPSVAQPAPVSPPAGGPQPPQMQPLNANGLTSQQQAQIDAVAGTGRMTVQQRMAAEQGFRNQNIQLQQKAFSDWIQVQQLQTSQGQLSVSQQNSALEYWKAAHPDAKVTLSGGEIITQDPRTGAEIAPRIQVNPERTHSVEGIAKKEGDKWVRAAPNDSGAVPGKWVYAGSQPVDFQPAASIPAGANYDIAIEDLKKDRGEIAAIGDAGRGAQQDNLRVQEMRDILQHADMGPGTETSARLRAWIARWTPGELSKWDGNAANLSGPAAVEMFQKLGFVGAVTQERGSTPRGGYQATKLFQQFNPGAQLLTSTNQGLLAQRLIANQAETDYAQAAQDHYNTQHQRLKSPERDYAPLSEFDAKWQAQRNPQVYAAAIGALGGQDPEMWSRGLSKDEIQRVKDVVTRADPNAVIHMPGEGKVVLQPNAKPLPPGFKVQ